MYVRSIVELCLSRLLAAVWGPMGARRGTTHVTLLLHRERRQTSVVSTCVRAISAL